MPRSAFLQVFLSDPDGRPVSEAKVRLADAGDARDLEPTAPGVFAAADLRAGDYRLSVEPEVPDLEAQERDIVLNGGPNSAIVSLGGAGDMSYPSADGQIFFRGRDDALLLAVRDDEDSDADFARLLDEVGLTQLELKVTGARGEPIGNDFVLVDLPDGLGAAGQRIDLLVSLARRQRIEVIPGAVIQVGADRPPKGLTNRMVVRFGGEVEDVRARKILRELGLQVLRVVTYAGNGYLVERAGTPDYTILDIAAKLNEMPEVVYAEPQILEVIQGDAFTPNDPLYPQQTYLPLINADDAWDTPGIPAALRGGRPDVCIAVFDDKGVAPNHPDLTANLTDGASKMLTSFNFRTLTAQTVAGLGGDHGTEVAGIATANFDNALGIAGVAPNCRLIGARLPDPATGIEMADAFIWAAGFNTGNTTPGFPPVPTQPADVIVNAWGQDNAALSSALRDGLDFLTVYGRGGRGCVVTFSVGNLCYVPFTNVRRYAAYERTVAVGSSIGPNPTSPVNTLCPDPTGNDTNVTATTDTRAFYSPYGPELDIVAPSHTCYDRDSSAKIDPTTSTVRVGTGSLAGDYDAGFGGTSHSTPVVGGAAALVISANPSLNWIQVREILRTTAVRIDSANTDPTGQYVDNDGDGVAEFSQWYGYGRVNVGAAVAKALDGSLAADVVVRENLNDTGAVPSPGWHASSPDIWVRAANDPIPALAYGADPPHQNAVRGQDNFVFARLKNVGSSTASEVYLRAMICHYPGFEFRYPQEFIPSVRPGGAVPNPLVPGTYLIGEVRIDDLLAGEDRIVKMTWVEALVPPRSVVIGGTTVNWHPCLLLEASPHDGPVAAAGSAIDIRRLNNICQRNIGIDDPVSGDDMLYGLVAGVLSGGRARALVIDLSRYKARSEVLLRVAEPKLMEQLVAAVRQGAVETGLPPLGEEDGAGVRGRVGDLAIGARESIRFPAGALVQVELADRRRMELTLAPMTGLRLREALGGGSVSVTSFGGDTYLALQSGEVYELPLLAGEGQLFPLILGSPDGAEPGSEIRVTQRRSDGALSAGYTIRS